jgi:hypothetical protein
VHKNVLHREPKQPGSQPAADSIMQALQCICIEQAKTAMVALLHVLKDYDLL